MGQAEADIRLMVDAYRSSFVASKPKITLSVFPDGEIQLFLDASERSHLYPSAIGSGQTLEAAATGLKTNFAKALGEIKARDEKELAALNTAKLAFYAKLDAAVGDLAK
jgi:cytidylate kinase